jgi:hypothetical protein
VKPTSHRWQFKPRFRRHAFGWKSQPAITRVVEAVTEIKKVARADPILGAEGAVLFLERVSPALEHVDGSSGAIGSTVNRAIDELVTVIAQAPADLKTREAWLERLWQAYEDDAIPYIEHLGDRWGDLCASPLLASRWADDLLESCRIAWGPDPNLRGYFKGTTSCLSSLLAAGRHQDILDLLKLAPFDMWHYRQYGVKAMAAMGQVDEAIRFAEAGRGRNDSPVLIARVCEEILAAVGRSEEAYRQYGLIASQSTTYLAWFRAVARKYPLKTPTEILDDLVALTPGEEGKWFAAAKDAGLYDEAIALANRSPTAPQTLTRAALHFADKNPAFALEAGLAALRWLIMGYGYDVTALDVASAFDGTMKAAEKVGRVEEARRRVGQFIEPGGLIDPFAVGIIRKYLGSAP